MIIEVLYVLDLKNNLLKVGELEEKNNRCKVYDSERGIIMNFAMSSNLMFKLTAVALPLSTIIIIFYLYSSTLYAIRHIYLCNNFIYT